MKVWIDIKVPHEPLFFKVILSQIPEHEYLFSCRYSREIVFLLKKYGYVFRIIGQRVQGNSIKRLLGFSLRVLMLALSIPKYDVLLNHCSVWAVYASKLRFKKNITMTDNEIDHLINKRLFKHVDYLVVPDSIPQEILIKDNMKGERIFRYRGFKEDIYIADYVPDPDFLLKIPFKNFITIRPEVLDTTYVPAGLASLVPDILKACKEKGINVLYLSRYEYDKEYVSDLTNVYIPPAPLNGLDVCHYSQAVLTGSGTLAREAACMGTPAISFFPGTELLAVDKALIENGKLFHSRNVDDIFNYISKSTKMSFELERCKRVKNEVISLLINIFNDIEKSH